MCVVLRKTRPAIVSISKHTPPHRMALVPYHPQALSASPTIDMNELLSARRHATHRKHGVYKKILTLCHRRIRYNAKLRSDTTWCVYQIPTFVPGLPRFDLDDCTRYCMAKLRENGFEITFVPPQTIIVSWDKQVRRAQKRAKARRRHRTQGARGAVCLRAASTSADAAAVERRRRMRRCLDAPPPRLSAASFPPRRPRAH